MKIHKFNNLILHRKFSINYTKCTREQRAVLAPCLKLARNKYIRRVNLGLKLNEYRDTDISTKDAYDIFVKNLPSYWKHMGKSKYAKPYMCSFSKMNTDPFVRKCLKSTRFVKRYRDLSKYTKSTNNIAALKTLSLYGENKCKRPSGRFKFLWQRALAITRERFFHNKRILRKSLYRHTGEMDPGSSAGNTFPGLKKGECYREIFAVAKYMRHMIKLGPKFKGFTRPLTRIAYRGHLTERGYDNLKTRVIFVTPAEVQLLEAYLCSGLYEFQLKRQDPMFFGPGSIAKLRDLLHSPSHGHSAYTADVSHFDADITDWMMYDAMYHVIRPSLSEYVEDEEGNVWPTDQSEIDNLLWWIYNYNVYTPIALPNGEVVQKSGGLCSGSYLTQLLGSIINYASGTFIDLLFNLQSNYFYVLGDDSRRDYTVETHDFPINEYADRYRVHFGFTVHPEKCILVGEKNVDDDKFLGYRFRNGRLWRPTEKWFAMALFPENDVDNLADSVARLLAFLLIGASMDADFCDFFRQFCSGYKVRFAGKVERALARRLKYSIGVQPLDSLDLKHFDFLNAHLFHMSRQDVFAELID